MNPLRLLIVTLRFWPMAGPIEMAVGDLASTLKSLGHDIEIITARWGKGWPGHFLIREIPVHRIARPSGGPWGSYRFQRALTRFIDRSFDDGNPFDGILVFGLGQETENILRLVRGRNASTRVVTRVDPNINPYHQWSHNANRRVLFGLDKADGIVADSELTADFLVRFGVKQEQIEVIHDGVPIGELDIAGDVLPRPRTRARQISARRALSDAHPVLSIDPDQQLVVSAASMSRNGGLVDLVKAWATVIKSYPLAKLWLLGDGNYGQQVWNAITSRELVHSVIMPGYFDDLQEVFEAADLYVHPYRTDASCNGLTKAMANGLCPVATLGRFSDKFVKKNVSGIVTVSGNSKALAEAILHGLRDASLRTRLGHAASKRVCEKLPLIEQSQRYVKLLTKQADPVIQNVQ